MTIEIAKERRISFRFFRDSYAMISKNKPPIKLMIAHIIKPVKRTELGEIAKATTMI